MKGLILKEWYSLKETSNFKMTLLFMVGSLGFGFLDNMRFMLLFVPMIAAMLPRMVLSFDENCKWQQFSLALPYSRGEIVSAKYVMILVLCGCSSVMSCVSYSIASALKGSFDAETSVFILLLGLGIGLLIPSVSMPIDLKFGTASGKVMTMIWGGILGCSVGLLMNLMGQDGFLKLGSGIMEYLPFIAAGAALVIYIASWLISVKIYEKKEF